MEGENEHVKVKMGGEKGAAGQTKKGGNPRRVGVQIWTSWVNMGVT